MLDLLRQIFSYSSLVVQFITKTSSLSSYRYENDFELSGHSELKKKSTSSTDEIDEYEYVDVEAKRRELAKLKSKKTRTAEENDKIEKLKPYRSGYAKFNDEVDAFFNKSPRIAGFIKGAANFFSSRGLVFSFSLLTISITLTAFVISVTAPVSIPAVIGLAAAGLTLNAILLGKSFISAVTSDKSLREKKLDYSLNEEIKKEKQDLESTISKNPALKFLLSTAHLQEFGQNARHSVSTGAVIGKDLLFAAPSFGLSLASNIVTLNVPAIITSLLSTILFRAASIKQGLAAANKHTEFSNYMAKIEEVLGIRNATPEQKADILGRLRLINSAVTSFLNENKAKLAKLNDAISEAQPKISDLEQKIAEVDKKIIELEEKIALIPKATNQVNVEAIIEHKHLIEAHDGRHKLLKEKLDLTNAIKNNPDYQELEKSLLVAVEKEPLITPPIQKPTLWESFKRVFNPKNLFSYERNCEMQTPFGADGKFYNACSKETYADERSKTLEDHGIQVSKDRGKTEELTKILSNSEENQTKVYKQLFADKFKKIQSFHKDDPEYRKENKQHLMRMKAHEATHAELERLKKLDEKTTKKDNSNKLASVKKSKIHTTSRL